MKKWLKVLIPIAAAPVAVMFPIVLVTGCANGDTQYVVEEDPEEEYTKPEEEQPVQPEDPVEPVEEPEEPVVDPEPTPVEPEPETPEDPVVDPEEQEETEEEQIVTWSGETQEQYLKNRTVALKKENAVGTGWILADATPDVADDFKYWVVTNAHVALAFDAMEGVEKIGSFGTCGYNNIATNGKANWKYACDIIEEEDRTYFGNFNFKWNYIEGIDLAIAQIDFQQVLDIQTDDVNISYKIILLNYALKQLNNVQKEYGKINQFAEELDGNELYVGGFPEYNLYAYWQFNEINIEEMKVGIADEGVLPHNIGNSELIDNAAQLIIQKEVELNWLGAGASGSMLIDQYNQILGIYWGGFGAEEEGYFYPAFSVINQELILQYI